MAHVRAVGKVVRADAAREKLVQKRRLVRSPARGVEDRSVRVGGPNMLADDVEGLGPRDRRIVGVTVADDHRMGDPARLAEPVLGLLLEFGDGMLFPPAGGGHAGGVLLSESLGTVLAEFDLLPVPGDRFRPGAAGAVDSARLVDAEHRAHGAAGSALFEAAFEGDFNGFEPRCRGLRFADDEIILVDVVEFDLAAAHLCHCQSPLTGELSC